ncbi:GNAT family N-acetyltransferase [Maribacter sp.]|nr:GNAT family N-acetyltransferase [Maribacter sp.]
MTAINLSSERLSLRCITMSDLDTIHTLHSLPETDKFNTLGIPENIEVTKSIITGWILDNKKSASKNLTFAVTQKASNTFIGLIALKIGSEKFKNAEVWYKLHSDHWGKGFGTEALNLILDYGFGALKLHRIQAGCAIDNIGSIKLLEKVGMTREGRKRQVLPLKSGWSDNFEYAILETDERINPTRRLP